MGFATTTFTLSLSGNLYIACAGMLLGGISWIFVISTLMTVVQQVVSSWVRARAVSVFLAIFFGGMALGSLLWGWVASYLSISQTLFIAGVGLTITNLLTYLFTSGENLIADSTPSRSLPMPSTEEQPHYEQGPVMVTVEYIVDPKQMEGFSQVMKKVRRLRLREGAFFWSLFKVVENPNKFVECFMADTWVEHLRQHERESVSDRELLDKAATFHRGDTPRRITHFVAHEITKKSRHPS